MWTIKSPIYILALNKMVVEREEDGVKSYEI